MREYTKVLRDLIETGATDDAVQALINEQMGEIYTVVGICLGIPPTTFTWEYNDKSKAYKKLGPLTPVEFYQKHVKPCFNVDDKVNYKMRTTGKSYLYFCYYSYYRFTITVLHNCNSLKS